MCKVAIAGAAATSAVGFVSVHAASAQTDIGTPTIYDSSGSAVISSGGSSTGFRLGDSTAAGVLPGGTGAGGACPGDTASGGYNVWTFLTYDNGTNGGAPATLTLGSSGGSFAAPAAGYASEPPTPALPLADPTAAAWGGPSDPEATAVTTGVVINMPTFQVAPFLAGDFINGTPAQAAAAGVDLFPGTWDLGVACTAPAGPALTNYWNVQFTITASSTDPNGFTWSVVPTATTPEAPLAIALPLSALGIGGIGFLVLRRSKRRAPVPVS